MEKLTNENILDVISPVVEAGQALDGANARYQEMVATEVTMYADLTGRDINQLTLNEIRSIIDANRADYNREQQCIASSL